MIAVRQYPFTRPMYISENSAVKRLIPLLMPIPPAWRVPLATALENIATIFSDAAMQANPFSYALFCLVQGKITLTRTFLQGSLASR
jgi:hypothetical protein